MRPIQLGVIGVGRFGCLHLDVFKHLKECSVVALSDINATQLRSVSRKYRITKTYINPLDLIRSNEIEAIDIVTSEATHSKLVIEALKHGKHVFVEKPLAISFKEAEVIGLLAKKTGRMVMVGNISRFSQPYVTMKRRVKAGELGKLGMLRAKRDFSKLWFKSFGKRVHTVYESGIHDIDLILWFTKSRCIEVYATERRLSGYKFPDLFTANLTFEDGLIVSLTSAWLLPRGCPQNMVETLALDGTIDADFEILGTHGSVRFKMLDSGLSIWSDKQVQHPEMTLWPTEQNGVGGAIRAELSHFLNQIHKGMESKVAPLSDSIYALSIAEAIVNSAKYKKIIKMKGERP